MLNGYNIMNIKCFVSADEKLENLEKQLSDMQKEMLRLEKDNKNLRQRLLLRQDSSQTHRVQVSFRIHEYFCFVYLKRECYLYF